MKKNIKRNKSLSSWKIIFFSILIPAMAFCLFPKISPKEALAKGPLIKPNMGPGQVWDDLQLLSPGKQVFSDGLIRDVDIAPDKVDIKIIYPGTGLQKDMNFLKTGDGPVIGQIRIMDDKDFNMIVDLSLSPNGTQKVVFSDPNAAQKDIYILNSDGAVTHLTINSPSFNSGDPSVRDIYPDDLPIPSDANVQVIRYNADGSQFQYSGSMINRNDGSGSDRYNDYLYIPAIPVSSDDKRIASYLLINSTLVAVSTINMDGQVDTRYFDSQGNVQASVGGVPVAPTAAAIQAAFLNIMAPDGSVYGGDTFVPSSSYVNYSQSPSLPNDIQPFSNPVYWSTTTSGSGNDSAIGGGIGGLLSNDALGDVTIGGGIGFYDF